MSKVNLEKIIKYGLYLTALIPLVIFSEFISPFHFGKILVFRSLVEILTVFYVVLLVRYGKSYLPPRTPLFWTVTFFTLAFGLTTFTSINVYQSFFGTLERMGGWFSFMHFWLFFVIASAVLRKKEDWFVFIKLSLAVSLLSAFYGFLQKTDLSWVIGSGGRNKIFGTIGNPALFAGYMIVNAFLALMLYFRPSISQNEKFFYGSVFILDAFAVLLAGVRGSVLGVVVGLIVFGLLYSFSFNSQKFKKLTLGFLILVFVVAGILYSLRNAEFVKGSHYLARYSDISLNSFTVQTRFWAWQAGFNGWNDSLKTIVFGWGPEMFNVPFSKHFNPKFFRGLGSETLFDRAHNQFLEVLFTMGFVGFTAYILIFFRVFQILSKMNDTAENKVFRIGLISTLVAYAIHNFFIFDTSANYLMFFLIIGFINMLMLRDANIRIHTNDTNIKSRNLATNIVGFILAAIAIFSIYTFEVVPAKANYATTRAIIASWSSNHDLAYQKFKEAMNYDTFGKYDIRHRYGQYILERANSQGATDEKMKERLFTAIENIKKNTEESPQDYLPYLYISRLYIMLGKSDPNSSYNDTALDYSLKALDISPTFVRTYYEVAQAYLNKKDYQKAIEWFKKVVELNPDVKLSHWYLGITLAQSGQLQKGAQVIENSGYEYKSNETDALRMVDLYFRLGNYKKLAEIYEALVKLSSRNPQYFASLAAAYKGTGEIDKAIKAAQTAAQIDPTFAKEAQDFINSLR
ncbi:MAG: O-antigen ligase family protein [Parcubacteria group bacterium]|nr:O-antigen ligase family protein [Parcubacteria group bacterium]